jgi:large subunit ribosomal protein L18e
MGIDLDHRQKNKNHKREIVSDDPYLRLLVKLYKFLSRRTGSSFNQIVLQRMQMSKVNKPPVSLSKIVRLLKGKGGNTIVVVVGTVTNDERFTEVPKMSVCALRFSKNARNRILKAGGRCLTFDQLALERPNGQNTLLLRGRTMTRESVKHFRGIHGVRSC